LQLRNGPDTERLYAWIVGNFQGNGIHPSELEGKVQRSCLLKMLQLASVNLLDHWDDGKSTLVKDALSIKVQALVHIITRNTRFSENDLFDTYTFLRNRFPSIFWDKKIDALPFATAFGLPNLKWNRNTVTPWGVIVHLLEACGGTAFDVAETYARQQLQLQQLDNSPVKMAEDAFKNDPTWAHYIQAVEAKLSRVGYTNIEAYLKRNAKLAKKVRREYEAGKPPQTDAILLHMHEYVEKALANNRIGLLEKCCTRKLLRELINRQPME
jgi:hypothetical protein